jgi:hypothetical protein
MHRPMLSILSEPKTLNSRQSHSLHTARSVERLCIEEAKVYREAIREDQAAFAALGGGSSVPNTLSHNRLVTPNPFS